MWKAHRAHGLLDTLYFLRKKQGRKEMSLDWESHNVSVQCQPLFSQCAQTSQEHFECHIVRKCHIRDSTTLPNVIQSLKHGPGVYIYVLLPISLWGIKPNLELIKILWILFKHWFDICWMFYFESCVNHNWLKYIWVALARVSNVSFHHWFHNNQ